LISFFLKKLSSGNISTSYLPATPQEKGFLLQLEPRYPLFGGWKTEFTIGYNLPAENYLLRDAEDSSHYVLNISFTPNWKTDVVIEKLIVKVILPEGAKNMTVHIPYSIDKESRGIHHSYLDTIGRPVVLLEKSNLVNEHARFFQISYTFGSLNLLRKPLFVFGVFAVVCGVIMLSSRFELSILSDTKDKELKRARIQELLKNYKQIMEQRKRNYSELRSALERYLRNPKTESMWGTEYQRLLVRLKAHDQQVIRILQELDELADTLSTKLRHIEDKEQIKRQQLQEIISTKIQDKKNKTYKSGTEASPFEKQYEKLDQEINELVDQLTLI
jgi:oligosaccharyltransferase complex subunit alpha (ribophorin I)